MGFGSRPVAVSSTPSQDTSIAADKEVGRCRPDRKQRQTLSNSGLRHAETQAMLVDEVLDLLHRLAHVDGHDGEASVFVSLIQGFESAPLPYTVGSPGGPKVQKEDFATE